MKRYSIVAISVLAAGAALLAVACSGSPSTAAAGVETPKAASAVNTFPNPPAEPAPATNDPQTVVLAGGCFWGVQGVFERLKGVEKTTAGYSGGSASTAHYEIVSTGTTGHAESVQITYDPKVVSFGTLLKVFFSVVTDPTELDYQGPDHGTQYRSVIFFTNDEQKQEAESYIKLLGADKVYSAPIVTQVVPFKAFYPAEDYHQHFLDKNPDYPYIVFWDMPKIKTLDRLYPNLVQSKT